MNSGSWRRTLGWILVFVSVILAIGTSLYLGERKHEEAEAGETAMEALASVKNEIVNHVVESVSCDVEKIQNNEDESIVTKVSKIINTETRKVAEEGGNTGLATYFAGLDVDKDREMPVISKNDAYYIGVITIPDINVELPVQSTWSYPKLKKTPCRYYGSIFTDNLVIAGHNYQKHFGELKNVRTGDLVIFTDAEGTMYKYTVAEKEILKPTDVNKLKHTEYPLTLFTCTVGGETRTVIRCTKAHY